MPIDKQMPEYLVKAISVTQRACENEADDAYLDLVRDYIENPGFGFQDEEASKLAKRGIEKISMALSNYDKAEDKAEWRDYLDASYAELFLGASPTAKAPQESVYLGSEKVMYDKPYFAVLDVMKEQGWAKPSNFYEPEDHLAMELSFLLYLNEMAMKDPEKSNLWLSFKHDHLDAWVPLSLKDIAASDDMDFYSGIADLIKAVLLEID